jgi:hypothetical protein
MNDRKKILVTGVGGPTPRSFVRAIKVYGGAAAARYEFIGVDCNPLAYGLYDRTLFSKGIVVPPAHGLYYWDKINEIIEAYEIEGAIILPEIEVIEWAKNSSKLNRPIRLHLPSHVMALVLTDKHQLHQHLYGTGLVPKYFRIDRKDGDYQQILAHTGQPFWIRSTSGSSGLGSLKIREEAELRQWISINPGISEFLATEYLPGRNLACKLLYYNGRLQRTACAERVNYIMAKVAPSGVTGNTSFGRLINYPELVKLSVQALEHIAAKYNSQLNGIFTVDFKEAADGAAKITEVNIRHVAFTSSLAAGGANLPLDTLNFMFCDQPGDLEPIHYQFDEDLIFLRDVDADPIVMKESDLFK